MQSVGCNNMNTDRRRTEYFLVPLKERLQLFWAMNSVTEPNCMNGDIISYECRQHHNRARRRWRPSMRVAAVKVCCRHPECCWLRCISRSGQMLSVICHRGSGCITVGANGINLGLTQHRTTVSSQCSDTLLKKKRKQKVIYMCCEFWMMWEGWVGNALFLQLWSNVIISQAEIYFLEWNLEVYNKTPFWCIIKTN